MTTNFQKPEIGTVFESARAKLVIAGYIKYFVNDPFTVIYYLDGKRETCDMSELEYLIKSI